MIRITENKLKEDNKIPISIRILPQVCLILKKISEEAGIALSQTIDNALYYYIRNADIKYEIKQYELKKKSKKLKEINRCYYLIKNALRTIIDIQMSFIFISGSPNLKVVAHQIDAYLRLAESFPDDIKENIKNEIEELQKMKDIEYLSKRIKQIIPFKKTNEEIEWKKKKN